MANYVTVRQLTYVDETIGNIGSLRIIYEEAEHFL